MPNKQHISQGRISGEAGLVGRDTRDGAGNDSRGKLRKFDGTFACLEEAVSRTGTRGGWRELLNSQFQFRGDDGAILNWWQSTGTISFQGVAEEARALERALATGSRGDG